MFNHTTWTIPAALVFTVSIHGAMPVQDNDLAISADTERLSSIKESIAKNPNVAADAYVRLGLAVAGSFSGPAREGGPAGKQEEWSRLQSHEISRVLQWTEERIEALHQGESPFRVPRPARGTVNVENGVLTAPTYTDDPTQALQRPYWFAGYGVWGTAAAAIPSFWNIGVTLIQQERGPAGIDADGELTDGAKSILEVLQSAEEHGVKVDLLLSPHYMPEGSRSSPDLTDITREGHIAYNIDHPAARKFVERWLRTIVPMVKDSSALFSLCLSNEPEYVNSGRDPYSRSMWVEFLAESHPTVDALNALYETEHVIFEEVPVPPVALPADAGIAARRAYYDWARFNHRHIAKWHRWMNGIVKTIAPDVRTHVKAMRVLDIGHRAAFAQLPDPELLCEITDLAGCDAWATLPSHEGPDAYWWRNQEMLYDLLHSFRGQPVFDSELHPIEIPFGPEPIPVSQTRCVLWQGALHHRAATTLWVWEPWVEGVTDLQGTIYHRPANIYAAGRAMLDLNRLAEEVAAVSRVRPKVALLYSMPSVFWEEDYLQAIRAAYTALLFLGQPVTFVSERQLAKGNFSPPNAAADWILVPRATHVTDAAVEGLQAFIRRGGRVIRIGSDCLAWDEYHRPRKFEQSIGTSAKIGPSQSEKEVMAELRPVLAAGGCRLEELKEVGTGNFAWNVEFQVVPFRDGQLVPMMNYGNPKTVALNLKGRATDLLSGDAVNLDAIDLESMEPRMLFVQP